MSLNPARAKLRASSARGNNNCQKEKGKGPSPNNKKPNTGKHKGGKCSGKKKDKAKMNC